jgi:hypothetical protein
VVIVVSLEAMLEKVPTENPIGRHVPRHLDTVHAEGATHESARDAIDALVPDGWRLIWVRRVDA